MPSMQSVVLVMLVGASGPPASAREWTDSSGAYHQEGTFVAYRDGAVLLRTEDGRQKRVALERLSPVDRAYVHELLDGQSTDPAANTPSGSSVNLADSAHSSAINEPLAIHPTAHAQSSRQTEPLPDMDEADPQANEAELAAVWKRVYTGHWVDFHLIVGSDPREWTSSVRYYLKHPTPHGYRLVQYLANLRYEERNDPDFLYWRPSLGDPHISLWAIARRPDFCGRYRVYAQSRGGWKLRDRAYRSVPR